LAAVADCISALMAAASWSVRICRWHKMFWGVLLGHVGVVATA
jgi:hypothetical protein